MDPVETAHLATLSKDELVNRIRLLDEALEQAVFASFAPNSGAHGQIEARVNDGYTLRFVQVRKIRVLIVPAGLPEPLHRHFALYLDLIDSGWWAITDGAGSYLTRNGEWWPTLPRDGSGRFGRGEALHMCARVAPTLTVNGATARQWADRADAGEQFR